MQRADLALGANSITANYSATHKTTTFFHHISTVTKRSGFSIHIVFYTQYHSDFAFPEFILKNTASARKRFINNQNNFAKNMK